MDVYKNDFLHGVRQSLIYVQNLGSDDYDLCKML